MSSYEKVLVAIDLTEESREVIKRASDVAPNANFVLVHVIEPLTYSYGGDVPLDLSTVQNQLQEQAEGQLAKLAEDMALGLSQQMVLIGSPTGEIHRVAKEKDIQLIVVGSHGRQGLALLLGSTANGVLHGVECDVLAVRV